MYYPKEKNITALSIGEKVKLLRKAMDITQAELAEAIWTNPAKISAVENGTDEYNEEQLEAIKKYFNIVDMPLSEQDCIAFKKRLYIWRDIIRDRLMTEAKEMYGKMSAIVNLDPCDSDLPMLYRLFEVVLLLYEGSIDLAEEKLNHLSNAVKNMTPEHLHYYYSNKGLLNSLRGKYEVALNFFMQAFELRKHHKDAYLEDDERLYYGMAECYTNLERVHCAIKSLHKLSSVNKERRTEIFTFAIDNLFALNYLKMGEYEEAEELLNNCLIITKGIDNKFLVGMVLYNLGLLNSYSKKWKKAMQFLDQAMSNLKIDSAHYLWSFYHKINCVIKNREFSNAEKLIEQAKDLYRADESKIAPFESLNHLLSINKRFTQYNDKSTDYIENITIPFFINQHDYFIALSYYETLEQHYKKIRNHKKSLSAAKDMRDIYEKVYRPWRE